MADISELLSHSNPEQYKKLLDLRDQVRMSQGENAANASKAAAESDYGNLFSKQLSQDAVDAQSLPGKSAADSAKVFESAPPAEIPTANISEASKAAQEAEYSKLFGKGATQDAIDSSLKGSGKSAAESAETLIPALTKAPGSALAKGLIKTGKLAGRLNTAMLLGDAAYGELADPNEMKSQPVPGRPGYVSKGSDIMRDPEVLAGWENIAKGPVPLPNGGLTGDALEKAIANSRPKDPSRELASSDEDDSDDNGAGTPTPKKPTSAQEMRELVDKATGKKPVESAMNSSDAIAKLLGANDKELAEAKEQRDRNQLIAMLSHAGATTGAALVPLANIKPDNEFFQKLYGQASQPVTDVKNKQDLQQEAIKTHLAKTQLQNAMEKEDANSEISKTTREILKHAAKQAGVSIEVPETMTASNAEKILPGIEGMANRKLTAEGNSINRTALQKDKNDKEVTKLVTKMGEDLDPNRFRSGEMGKNQGRINAAERINTLLQQFPDGNIPKIQTREIATAVGALFQNGTAAAVSQVNELVPHTMRGKAADVAQWFTGNPQGQEQQQFIKLFADTANREKSLSERQIQQAQIEKAYTTHSKVKEMDPDSFYNTLAFKTHLTPDELRAMEQQEGFKKGRYSIPGADAHEDKEPAIRAFMKANKIKDRNQAIQILKDHGKL